MKRTMLAALLALVGVGLTAPDAADAAVLAPDHGAMRDQVGSAVIKVQRRQFVAPRQTFRAAPRQTFRAAPRQQFRAPRQQFRAPRQTFRAPRQQFRAGPRQSFRGTPNRGFRQGNIGRSGRIGRPGGPGRIGRPVGRGFAAHRRGFRPAGFRRWHSRHLIVRRWYHRPYYGRIIGGVALGTLLAASAYYAYAEEPPAPGLCWLWADEEETQGYWDYCEDPA